VATDNASTDLSINPHPTQDGGGFFAIRDLNVFGNLYVLVASSPTFESVYHVVDSTGRKRYHALDAKGEKIETGVTNVLGDTYQLLAPGSSGSPIEQKVYYVMAEGVKQFYALDVNGKKQFAIGGLVPFARTEMYGKPHFHQSDRVAVLVNLGYVLKDGREMQIRLCLEQQPGGDAHHQVDSFSVQYDTKDPTVDVSTWSSVSNKAYGTVQPSEEVILPLPMRTATLAALQAYIFSLGYINFQLDLATVQAPRTRVFASKTFAPVAGYAPSAAGATMYAL
jgi:hypothetical protein